MSKKHIAELANQIAALISVEDTTPLLDKTRELYEKVVIFHYSKKNIETETIRNKQEEIHPSTVIETTIETTSHDSLIIEDIDLSVQERIQQIMENAKKYNEGKKEVTVEKTIDTPVAKESIVEEFVDIEELTIKNKTAKTVAINIEEEFKDAISADYAADLFEKADKIEITKKSLNDKLSQKQIQIGLNDRIAFVKHLFAGSQVDFNRVLSQLNSFQTESQAKDFIKNMVKTEYNWDNQTEYEERLIALIERKFL
jgi:hypothetical protein